MKRPSSMSSWSVSFLLLLIGCGAPTAQVSGIVFFDSQPLTRGTVVAYSNDGSMQRAELQSDGRYVFERLPIGDTRWAVVCHNEEFASLLAPDGRNLDFSGPVPGGPEHAERLRQTFVPQEDPKAKRRRKSDPPPPDLVLKKVSHIPHRYADATTSNLNCDVRAGHNTFDIRLESAPAESPPPK